MGMFIDRTGLGYDRASDWSYSERSHFFHKRCHPLGGKATTKLVQAETNVSPRSPDTDDHAAYWALVSADLEPVRESGLKKPKPPANPTPSLPGDWQATPILSPDERANPK